MSSAMISSGLPDWMTSSSSGTIGCSDESFFSCDQDDRVLELGDHLVGVGDEVGAEVAAVELHAVDDLGLGLEALVLLDGDDALVADLPHRVGDLLADLGFAVGGDRADLADLIRTGDGARLRLDVFDDDGDGLLDAALEVHRVHAGCDRLHALADDRGGQNGRGGGAVAGLVIGAGRDFADHLRAHVLELVLELDLLGDGDAVLGDARRAIRLVDDDVAAFGSSVTFTASARMSTPLSMRLRASVLNLTLFGGRFRVLLQYRGLRSVSGGFRGGDTAVDDAENVALFHDQQVFAFDLAGWLSLNGVSGLPA